MTATVPQRFRMIAFALSTACLLPGCLFVRTTEHRIKINDNGTGEAYMRLTDIRSDAETDSARIHDFGVMIASSEQEGVKDFERNGRKIVSKRFMVSGDTLSAEVTYTFPTVETVEGIKFKDEDMFVVVSENREILKTNGKIKAWENNTQRIVWPRTAKRLMYIIREKKLPPSRSLASLYLKYGSQGSGGAH